MADNFLERKMEDLRAGRLKTFSSVSRPKQKGFIRFPFPQRRVLVTGGANGIGLAISRAYLQAGCKVAVFDKDASAGKQLYENEGVRFYHLDLSDTEATEKALEDLLKCWLDLDIVVNNAGVSDFKPITESGTDDFRRILNINLVPAFQIASALARHRERSPIANSYGGRMIIISSTRHIQSETGTEAYSASKGALASLTHSLMMSLSKYHITVNCISPGWINTTGETLTERDRSQHPSQRVGTPDDIARLCIFLSIPDNDFINGADIPVDGGMTRKMIYCETE